MGDFLEALADVAAAQAGAVARVPSAPAGTELPAAVPLRATTYARSPAWRDVLAGWSRTLRGRQWPGPAAQALRRLAGAWPEELEAMADGVLAGTPASHRPGRGTLRRGRPPGLLRRAGRHAPGRAPGARARAAARSATRPRWPAWSWATTSCATSPARSAARSGT